MATDDERREVAARLRGDLNDAKASGHYCSDSEAVRYICDVLGLRCSRCPHPWAGLETLADLIEPAPERTYHPERIGTAYHSALMCSACKYPLDDVTIYCPHCGARLEGVGR